MTVYHINKNKEVKPCNAKKYSCRFSQEQHFNNLHEAQTYVEQELDKKYKNTTTLHKKKKDDSDSPIREQENEQERKRIKELKNSLRQVLLNDYSGSEMLMFKELAENDRYDEAFGMKISDGFPDEYMGLSNGRELLTRASEGLFYPSQGNSYLYGKNRHENADKVRQWVLGYWMLRDHISQPKK